MFRLLEWFLYRVLYFEHYPDKPCPHLKDSLSDLSDGTAKGILRWYTLRHVADCPGCSSALDGLRNVRERLLRLNRPGAALPNETDETLTLSPERWEAIARAWERTDEELAKKS